MGYRDWSEGIFQLVGGRELANHRECRLPRVTRRRGRAGGIPEQNQDE